MKGLRCFLDSCIDELCLSPQVLAMGSVAIDGGPRLSIGWLCLDFSELVGESLSLELVVPPD